MQVNYYGVLAGIGRLTARTLGLPVEYYDEERYYNEVARAGSAGDWRPAAPGAAPRRTAVREQVMSDAKGASNDPSMDDILASIRKIISDDEARAQVTASGGAAKPAGRLVPPSSARSREPPATTCCC